MDWLREFQDKFGKDKDLTELRERKIYGSLKINFSEGRPASVDLNIHKKPE